MGVANYVSSLPEGKRGAELRDSKLGSAADFSRTLLKGLRKCLTLVLLTGARAGLEKLQA